MKKRQLWLVFVLMFALMVTGDSGARAADIPIEERAKVALDLMKGKIPYPGKAVTYTGKPITMRYSTFFAEPSGSWQEAMKYTFERLKDWTNGKIVTKNYFSNTLHGARDGFKALQSDISDLAHAYSIWHTGSFKLMQVFALPFLFPDAPVGVIVANELYPKYLKKEYERMGVYCGGIGMTATYNFLSKKPIRKLEDLKGMKVRTPGGTMSEAIKALGGVPVMLPFSEYYTGFQRGVIDVVCAHDAAFTVTKVDELGKYRTVLQFFSANMEYAYSKDFFDRQPKDLKTFLVHWQQLQRQINAQVYFEGLGAKSRVMMEKRGIETIILPPAEMKRWKDRVRPIEDQWVDKMEKEGVPAKALLDDLRKLTEKYSAMSWNDIMKQTMEKPVMGMIDF